MKKFGLYFIILLLFSGCSIFKPVPSSVKLKYLDDYIIPKDLEVGGTKVGGLSGIEYTNGTYYLICDNPGNPRFYKANIKLDHSKIDTIAFSGVVKLNRSSSFLKEHTLDLEAIRYNPKSNQLLISSEGAIKDGKDPSVFFVNQSGEFQKSLKLPSYFSAAGSQHPRNNGVFEGLAENINHSGYWVGMELPLKKDGSKPKLWPTKSPIRITNYNEKTLEPTSQFVVQLGNIKKIPWEYFAVNGLTDLLQYGPHQFLILERAFSAGHGSNGNTVHIYKVNTQYATNTLDIDNLKNAPYVAATKKLVFDFKSIKNQLKENIIDNIEGMTFGPELPNGDKSLLLISDNNFNTLGKQITQVILLEIEL